MAQLCWIRQNSIGMEYVIEFVSADETSISLKGTDKSITVHYPLRMIVQSWGEWQMLGHFVQKAFSYLDGSEREFLITGITPEEWSKIFTQEEEK